MYVIKTVYKLINKDIPVIVSNQIVEDPGVGVLKLVYKVTQYIAKEIKLGKKLIYIPWDGSFFSPRKVITSIFLRPFKTYWSETRPKELPKNFWCSKTHPLTNMWVELHNDYKSTKESGLRMMKQEIRDHNFVRHLKNKDKKFIIIINN